ncbi:MAG: hypothetical protein JWM14_614 [Chitinophagaceae bacterium]|nr:hypothetical protein [Chitinophagaceae bacterium]
MEPQDEHKLSLAYDLTQYDKVIVIIKPTSPLRENYPQYVKHDKSKDRYYITGKLVRFKFDRMNYYSYPVKDAIALVPTADVSAYGKATKEEKKREFIVNIFYGEILFITLDFDSLDWMK